MAWSDILEDDVPDHVKEKKVEIPYAYLHRTLSEFLLAQNVNRRVIPSWEDGSDVDVESDSEDESNSAEGESSSSEEGENDQEWTEARV